MPETSANARLEAFCDGVFAIALTLLIIDIKVPASEAITSTADLWRALGHLGPRFFAFLLSFAIILITWVNHHAMLTLVRRSSPSFIYANGLLLLTMVSVPFLTSLLGEFLLTDHAAPAVVVYNAVLAVGAIAWSLVEGTALRNGLTTDQAATAMMRQSGRQSKFGFVFYGGLAVAAIWVPFFVAILTTASWLFWLVFGIRLKRK